MEDAMIIALYWDRDQQAIQESDLKYGAFCHSLSYRILGSREDSEECVNDTWSRAWNSMPPQRPDSLRAFLGRIVRNLSLDRWRQRQARKRGGLTLLLDELEECIPAAPSPEQVLEDREITKVIDNWLAGLSPEDRALFLRRYWYGERVDELAKLIGCTPGQMAQRMLRLRRSLRRALEAEGISL